MEHGDEPDTDEALRKGIERCETADGDPECCGGNPAVGDDPCKGCKIATWLDWEPDHPLVEYAFFLNSWLEMFSVGPDEMSWRDHSIYMVFLAAKAAHEKEKLSGPGNGSS